MVKDWIENHKANEELKGWAKTVPKNKNSIEF